MKANARGLSSIAFPALGTGKLQFPPDKVADAMFQAVSKFNRNVGLKTLKTVLFVVSEKDPKILEVNDSYLICYLFSSSVSRL